MSKSKKKRGRPTTFHREENHRTCKKGLLLSAGPNGMSINELCRRIKISKNLQSIENFGGEDGLLSAVIENYRSHILKQIMQHFENDRNLHQQLIDLVCSSYRSQIMPNGCLIVKCRYTTINLDQNQKSHFVEQKRLFKTYFHWY